MPYARRRKADALNRAYAHVSEASFGAAASALADKLVSMGFDEQEAKEVIEPAQGHLDDTGLFAPRDKPAPVFRHTVAANPDVSDALASLAGNEGVAIITRDDGAVEIAVTGRVAADLEAAITSAIPTTERQGFSEAVRKYRVEIKDQLSPAEQGEPFKVPRLVAEVQGNLEFADAEVFMEFHDWTLASHPARLDEAAFAIRETARSFKIDVDGNRVSYQFASEAEQLALDVDIDGWSPHNLILWLDRQLRQPDIHQLDLLKWLTDCVGHLVGPRKIHIAALMRTKFILARKLRERLAAARAAEQNAVYQRYLRPKPRSRCPSTTASSSETACIAM
jgi:type III restriction enzyme